MDNTSAISLLDALIAQAVSLNVSDIHLESTKDYLRVRYRIDGLLIEQPPIENEWASHVLARLKVLAALDVAERRIPQDGKLAIQGQHGEIDLRVATFPCLYGEKIVIRILDRYYTSFNLDHLGCASLVIENIKRVLHSSQGFFLVTGPTGSGKTTTLYAGLAYLYDPCKNIVTLEDPIEYTISGITQTQINSEIGFTFAKGLRSLMRQDPDIIMVGEIRDRETADVAIQAALTGHLVVSTLHTINAPGAVMRLLDMGIPPFLINACVSGVLAQRLVRVLCPHCRYQVQLSDQEQELCQGWGWDIEYAYSARGCDACNGIGYKGRIGIFELLIFSPSLRALITAHPSFDALYAQACADGMTPLLDDAFEKVSLGLTSIKEIIRVLS